MDMLAKGLGKEIEKVTVEFEVARAKRDITHEFGMVKEGTVGGQHYEWTAWADGKPLIVYNFFWQLGDSTDDLDPLWEEGESCYRVRLHGAPSGSEPWTRVDLRQASNWRVRRIDGDTTALIIVVSVLGTLGGVLAVGLASPCCYVPN